MVETGICPWQRHASTGTNCQISDCNTSPEFLQQCLCGQQHQRAKEISRKQITRWLSEVEASLPP